jgi:acetyl esterase/lipase
MLHADPSKAFILGGESAGANLCVVMSLLARDRKLSPPITGLLLSIPPVINPDRVPERFRDAFLSYEQNADAPILSSSSAYEASSTSTK